MKYNTRYPSVATLKLLTKKRIPKFAFDYLEGGIDDEVVLDKNRQAFQAIELAPCYLCTVSHVDTRVTLFDKTYELPIGVPPVGLGSMIWPGADRVLARAAQEANIPFTLSTVSNFLLEDVAKIAPDVCWFQLYVPKNENITLDIIKRLEQSKFNALIVTLDIPVGAKRNRDLKNGICLPFKLRPKIVWGALTHPCWMMQTLCNGMPDFVNLIPYKEKNFNGNMMQFMDEFFVKGVTKEYVAKIRSWWDGPLILKGIQNVQNVLDAEKLGVDGIILSNHGGRQLDAAPSSLDSLRQLPESAYKKLTIMLDSGIRTGLDIIRAKALGAQLSFSGRSFYYGVGALGKKGGNQVIEIYRDEIIRTLQQIGCPTFSDVDSSSLHKSRLV